MWCVELILEISKLLLLHLVGFLYYFAYIDDARSNTNQAVIASSFQNYHHTTLQLFVLNVLANLPSIS
jgi:hypothetical protein